MLKDLQVTLYDIFGYLLPGFISLNAFAILFWAIYFPTRPLSFQIFSEHWLGVGVASYVFGHMTQAVANILFQKLSPRLFQKVEDLMLPAEESNQPATQGWLSKVKQLTGGTNSLSEKAVSSAKSKARKMINEERDPEKEIMDSALLYLISDETVAQWGVTNDRDIYIYREGFYRGLTISFLLLFVVLVTIAVVPKASINISESRPIGRLTLFIFALISLIASALSFYRYRRFASYKVKQAVLGFLAIQQKLHDRESQGQKGQ